MKKLQTLTEEKNVHMTHLEDSIFTQGVKGTRQAIMFLIQMRDTLTGYTKSPINTSVKWDGAPAIFVGEDPRDGKFFVAKKGIFNKTPLVYKTQQEISNASELGPELKDKFSRALKHLSGLGINGVIQGDFLFSAEDLKKAKIDGEDYITFHPNTLVYAFPYDSLEGKKLRNSDIGIVWHTTYNGSSFDDMKASYGVKMPAQSNKVWQVDAMYNDVSGSASLTNQETMFLKKNLTKAGQLFKRTPARLLNAIQTTDLLQQLLLTYTNSFIRANRVPQPRQAAQGFVQFISDRITNEINSKKTQRGKDSAKLRTKPMRDIVVNTPINVWINIFELYSILQSSKNLLVKKLNSGSFSKTFLRTKDGYRVTGQEGFVAIDHLGKNAVKFVDRLEFSYANFSPDVMKGWQTDRRK